MSSLKERLSRLKRSAEPIEKPVSGLGQKWDELGAVLHTNEWGQFIVRERRFPLDHAHGMYRLGELCGGAVALSALEAEAGANSGKGVSACGVSHEELLFLDTETTGLGIGAGNVPFMIGIGYYDADQFVVEQLFIRNPAEEAAMLAHLKDRLQKRSRLVSYNGKCFDWPIIRNRYVMNRFPPVEPEPIHFDFLYPSRSLWRNTLPSCRLSSVEKARLGLTRMDDVPGSLAPTLYFQYLAEGNPGIVSGVFDHNEKDILTLAALAVHFVRLLEGRIPLRELEAEEVYRLAVWMDKLGQTDRAAEAFGHLLDRPYAEKADYLLPAAAYYKRRKQFAHAVPLWQELVKEKGRRQLISLEPYIELAMYYEHHEKDLQSAYYFAEEALNRAWSRLALARGDKKQRMLCDELQKRVDRLKRKARNGSRRTAVPERNCNQTAHSGKSDKTKPLPDAAARTRPRKNAHKIRPVYAMDTLL